MVIVIFILANVYTYLICILENSQPIGNPKKWGAVFGYSYPIFGVTQYL
jgi:hypothetical protein